MAKKKKEEKEIKLEDILSNCRDYLRGSASLNDKRDVILTLVFLRFIGEKFEELLKKTLDEYHNRRTKLSSEEASKAQQDAVDEIIRNATQQALDLLNQLGEDKDSFRKLGLTFEEKAFYDILMHLRDTHNFEYGEDKKVGSFVINEKCKAVAKKVKELIDTKSSFADWLSNKNVRAELNQDLFFFLDENGYPHEWNDEVFDQVLDQVENYKTYN